MKLVLLKVEFCGRPFFAREEVSRFLFRFNAGKDLNREPDNILKSSTCSTALGPEHSK
jgi:hypothetical protein